MTLSPDQLQEKASRAAGLTDFGDLPFKEALSVLTESLEREAKLTDQRRATTEGMLVGLLVKRLRLVNDRKIYPDIAKEVVRAPVIIIGLPRTGSTHLHALMARGEGIRAPLMWEMQMPSPPPARETFASDPRIAEVQAGIDKSVTKELLKRHPTHALLPEQCIGLVDWTFTGFSLFAQYEIPTFWHWYLNTDYAPIYEAHRRTLQHLQWRNAGQWVLKYPKHLFCLRTLLNTYPDARLVWTHRDPASVIPSVISFVGAYRSPTPGFDFRRFGPEWAAKEELGLLRGLSMREEIKNPAQQPYDVHYRDLMRDPVGTVERIYKHCGLTFSDRTRTAVNDWVVQNPQTKHGEHKYDAADFGLDKDRLRERFGPYMRKYDVT